MARLPRLSVAGWPHLVVHRGHNRQPVFVDDEDRRCFLAMLQEAALANGLAVHAYGLGDNEVRLLGTPHTADGLSRVMQALGRRYGAYFNRRHDHTGGLWEGRFRATVIDPEQHLLSCMRFAEAVAALPNEAVMARWSSAGHHTGQTQDKIVSDHSLYWSLGNTPFEREMGYRRLLDKPVSAKEEEAIDSAVMKGWPLGGEHFKGALQSQTERRLTPRKRGRPPRRVEKSVPN
jgi:putative transposase